MGHYIFFFFTWLVQYSGGVGGGNASMQVCKLSKVCCDPHQQSRFQRIAFIISPTLSHTRTNEYGLSISEKKKKKKKSTVFSHSSIKLCQFMPPPPPITNYRLYFTSYTFSIRSIENEVKYFSPLFLLSSVYFVGKFSWLG